MDNPFQSSDLFDEAFSDILSSDLQSNQSKSDKENSSFFAQAANASDLEDISDQSKKIRKKRTAYQRIDDDIRLQLWEAVHKRGESLKSAAKRLKVNYSSAKSIFHTYRKEGRILKKTLLEKSVKICNFDLNTIDMSPINNAYMLPQQTLIPEHKYRFPEQYLPLPNFPQQDPNAPENRPPSPMRGLTHNFDQLLLNNPKLHFGEDNPNIFPTHHLSRDVPIPSFSSAGFHEHIQQHIPPQINLPPPESHIEIPLLDIRNDPHPPQFTTHLPLMPTEISITQPTINPPTTVPTDISNPLENLRNLDNFYMNYSNSPLSGGPNFMKECYSNPGSRSFYQNEFESFSEMLNAMQTPVRHLEENRHENSGSKSQNIRGNLPQPLSQRVEGRRENYEVPQQKNTETQNLNVKTQQEKLN